jgi:thiol-disulfide isomerase/thioredoxin
MEKMLVVFPYLLAGFVAVIIGAQVTGWWVARRFVGKPAPDFSDLLGEAEARSGRAGFYFYRTRCPPCASMTPRIDRLKPEYPRLIKVDVREQREVARRFGVGATPTLIVVENGRIAAALIGDQSERRLRKVLGPPAEAREG